MWSQGQRLRGRLIEETDNSYWLVSINGQLIQVRNSSGLRFRKDQWVVLEVKALKPLEFSVIGQSVRKNSHINVRI